MAETKKSWKWLKRILWGLLTLVVLLFLAVSVVVYLINSESYLEDYIAENLGLEADIGELDVSLLSGTIKITSSTIGPKSDPYIQFEELNGELDYSNLWSSQLTIELLELTNAKVRYPIDFKLKESQQESSEETSLPFDFIDVAAIDINNLDFEYRDDITLLAKGADIKVRNIPVAESGFLLFEDLERLVEASQTTVEAKLSSLQSDKTQLNNIRINAYIEEQKLIIEEVKSGESSINIDLVDHSQQSSSQQANTQQAISQQSQLDLPFSDVVIQTIDLGKTDLSIQDKEELSINAIEVAFSELLLVKDRKALWLDWQSFYKAQNSQFKLSSNAMTSSMVNYEKLELAGALKQGKFTLPTFQLARPEITISNQNLSTSPSVNEETVTESKADQNWYLPFESIRLENGLITDGAFKIQQADQKHTLDKLAIKLSNVPLVLSNQPVFALETLNVGEHQASITLSQSSYSGALGSVESVTSQLTLKDDHLTIKSINLNKPDIQYQTATNPSTDQQSDAATGKDATKKDLAAPSENDSLELPVSGIDLEQLVINNASVDFSMDKNNWAGSGINTTLKTVPIYQDGKLVVVQPELWQEQAVSTIEAGSLTLPQGSVTNLFLDAAFANNQLSVSNLKVAGANISVDTNSSGSKQPSGSTDKLPIEAVELENIQLKNVALDYRNDDLRYQLSGGDLNVSYFPLIKNGEFVSDPMPYLQNKTNRLMLQADEVTIPEGSIRGLSINGVLRDKDLMLDHLRTDSADIAIINHRTEQSLSDEELDEKNSNGNTATAEPFLFRTIKVADLKLQNINAEISQKISTNDDTDQQIEEKVTVKNLYLGATELMLAKNHQTLDQWYSSQLENAFTLVALKVDHIQHKQNDIHDLTITAVQKDRKIEVQPLRLTYNDAPLSARWSIDLAQQPYHSTYISEFNNLHLEKLIEPADEDSVAMTGALQGDIDITFSGLDIDTILSTLDGSVIVGNQSTVTLHRLNVNKVLRSFLDSQSFGLLDIGGFLLAGPLGLLASQGLSLQDTLSQLGADQGDTILPNLHIDMSLAGGVLQTKDVAAATEKYRFAFNGQVNLAKQEFNDFRFDIINEKGCSEYGQTLNGSLSSPEIETFTAAFDAVTGSITGLFKQGVGLITGGACSAVYEGVVPHPKEGAVIIPKEQQKVIDPNAPKDGDEDNTEEIEPDESLN